MAGKFLPPLAAAKGCCVPRQLPMPMLPIGAARHPSQLPTAQVGRKMPKAQEEAATTNAPQFAELPITKLLQGSQARQSPTARIWRVKPKSPEEPSATQSPAEPPAAQAQAQTQLLKEQPATGLPLGHNTTVKVWRKKPTAAEEPIGGPPPVIEELPIWRKPTPPQEPPSLRATESPRASQAYESPATQVWCKKAPESAALKSRLLEELPLTTLVQGSKDRQKPTTQVWRKKPTAPVESAAIPSPLLVEPSATEFPQVSQLWREKSQPTATQADELLATRCSQNGQGARTGAVVRGVSGRVQHRRRLTALRQRARASQQRQRDARQCSFLLKVAEKHQQQAANREQEEADLLVAVQELEVAAAKLGRQLGKEPQLLVPHEGLGCASLPQRLRVWSATVHELLPSMEKIELAVEVLAKIAICPLTLARFRHPMLAPDGQTYERSSIAKWLRINSISPTSREPMRLEHLIRNRPMEHVVHALSLLQPCGVDDEEESDEHSAEEEHSGEPQDMVVGVELLHAIENQQAALALELLQRPVQEDVLNGVFGDNRMTLLQIALIKRLPDVALALLNTSSFTAGREMMGPGRPSVSALHLSVALGELAVCQAILQRLGRAQLVRPVLRSLSIISCGEELHFQRDLDSLDIAERFRQREVLSFLQSVADAILAAAE